MADNRPKGEQPEPTQGGQPQPDARPYDIVVFGATGFTGLLTAKYLANAMQRENFNWAIAGRTPSKLHSTKQQLISINPDCERIGTLNADITDLQSLKDMASQAKVVITTVGPYLNYGEQVVKACVESGTHYCDLTGEPEFVDSMIHYYHDIARNKQIKIVNSCGFDSIPHDLGALFAVNALNELLGDDRAGKVPVTVEGFVSAGGTFSGGTWHSAITQFSRLREYEQKRKSWRSHSSKGKSSHRKVSALRPSLSYRKEFSAWACPFPTIDPVVVRRTAKERSQYGPDFQYGHYVLVKKFPKIAAGALGIGSVIALSQFEKTRNWLLKVKDPGQGPSDQQMEQGWFKVRMIAKAEGLSVWAEVTGGDPGYGETSKMLAESALCLALDDDKTPPICGVVTPGAAMGETLINRLQAAGIQFNLLT